MQYFFLIVVLVLAGCSLPSGTSVPPESSASSSSSVPSESSASSVPSESSESSVPSVPSVPSAFSLRVPFAPQAPFAVWDPLHQEACEEAALIMVHHFLEGTSLTTEEMEGDILALVAWETARGYGQDVTIAQLAAIARAYYGMQTDIISGEDVTVSRLKTLLAGGDPVIIPAQGQLLGNPYFSGAGPPYHMLVLTGYDGDVFITNDPGTRRGEGYRYDADVLLNAIHDWNGSTETVHEAPKAALVVRKR